MKTLGYALIITSCAISGIYFSRHYKCLLRNSYAYLELLYQINENISNWHLTLSKVYDSINIEELEHIGFMNTLRSKGLLRAYEDHFGKFIFDSEHISFCHKLGTMPLGDTIKLCNNEYNRLSKLLNDQKVDLEKKMKLYPALALLIGIAVIIMII